MIGRIVYGQTCKGTLNYVFGKEGMRILGYGNMCCQDISPSFFSGVLHFQGQRNATKNRYAHISLNLPHGEHLNDSTFLKMSEEYMEKMGYGRQPYVVVRHTDTAHEHVHIVTTNVREDAKVLSLFNSHRRNMATQRYLEKKYGLGPSPTAKQENELPVYRIPGPKGETENPQGTRYYIQDILNNTLQKYKVRSFGELARLVEPYHIEIKRTKRENGSIGVAYGLNNRNGYRTRFLDGSTVHRQLSGPKLQKMFDVHAKSKLLPMHRKRLLKQMETTYGLFGTINPKDLKEVLKEYQGINIIPDKKEGVIEGFDIHDSSGYVFRESELGCRIKIRERPDVFGKGDLPTQINIHGNQFQLEVQKLIKEALTASYLKSPKQNGLLSEHIALANLGMVQKEITASKTYGFLERYVPREQRAALGQAIITAFPSVRQGSYERETKREGEALESKSKLMGDVLQMGMFHVGTEQGSIHHLFQSLGLKYQNDRLSHIGSYQHSVPFHLGKVPLPKAMGEHVYTGFVQQNQVMLELLTENAPEKDARPKGMALFLPMVFPKLYGAMDARHRQRYENIALGAYVKHAERMHAPFEKSPKDYIAFFNAKGFYFERGENGMVIKSIYTNKASSFELPNRTFHYLKSVADLDRTLERQQVTINALVTKGRNDLKNLWAGYLMERGLYKRAAFMLVSENAYPNLHPDIVRHHMANGLRKTVQGALETRSTTAQDRLLRKSVYAISSLLGDSGKGQEDVNGFKDEFTDWTKYRGRGFSV